jgi:DNA-binding transcriptional LysR family regulator
MRSLVARNFGYGLLISRPHADVSYEGRPVEARWLGGPTLSINVSLAWATGVRRTRRARAFADHCRLMLPHRLGAGAGAIRTAT